MSERATFAQAASPFAEEHLLTIVDAGRWLVEVEVLEAAATEEEAGCEPLQARLSSHPALHASVHTLLCSQHTLCVHARGVRSPQVGLLFDGEFYSSRCRPS